MKGVAASSARHESPELLPPNNRDPRTPEAWLEKVITGNDIGGQTKTEKIQNNCRWQNAQATVMRPVACT